MTIQKICYVFAIITSCVLFAGCRADYGPQEEVGGFPTGGYSDKHIGANTIIVSYSGSDFAVSDRIKPFLFYRAAEDTVDDGYSYFVVTSCRITPQGGVAVINMYEKPVPGSHDAKAVMAHLGPATL